MQKMTELVSSNEVTAQLDPDGDLIVGDSLFQFETPQDVRDFVLWLFLEYANRTDTNINEVTNND